MDPRRFDEVARRLAHTLSRRYVVGGSLWAALLAALPSSETVLGKNRRQLRQRRRNERDQEQRHRENDKNRRNNKDQHGKNDGGGQDKQEHDRNAKGKRDGGKNSNRDRNQNQNQNQNQNRTSKDKDKNKDKDNDAHGSNRVVQGEACLNNGKRCGSGKKLKPCSRCCSGFNISTRSKKKKCACRPDGRGCQDNAQCCARVCFEGVCGALS